MSEFWHALAVLLAGPLAVVVAAVDPELLVNVGLWIVGVLAGWITNGLLQRRARQG